MTTPITPRLLSLISPSISTIKPSTQLNNKTKTIHYKENSTNDSERSISLPKTNFQSKTNNVINNITTQKAPIIPFSSKPSLTSTSSRNKLLEYKLSKKYVEEDAIEYQRLTNKPVLFEVHSTKIEQPKETIDEFEELIHYQQQNLPVPIEKKDDEKFKLLKMKQMKRLSLPSNKSVRKYDDWTTDYEKQIKTQLDYSTIKKRKISHSTRKIYSSLLKCYNFKNEEIIFPLFTDKDIGVYEYWQAHIIESKADEDVMTDDEQLMLAGAYIISEMKEAIECYVKEGDMSVKNLMYIKHNKNNKNGQYKLL